MECDAHSRCLKGVEQCPRDEIAGEGATGGELAAERGPGGRGETGGGGDGRRQPSSQPSLCLSLSLPSHPSPASPPPPPGSPHRPLWASSPASLHEILPSLHSLQHCWPRGGQGATPHPLHTRTCTLWTQHKYTGLQLQDPRGGSILSLAFRAQPAPETALGRVSPGQAGAKHLSLPSPGPRTGGLWSGRPLSTPGTALKKTGDHVHLTGLWRDLPVWLSRFPPLL